MNSELDFIKRPAIDVHGHIGDYPGYTSEKAQLFNVPVQTVSDRSQACNIITTIVSELGAFDAANARAVQAAKHANVWTDTSLRNSVLGPNHRKGR